MSCFFNNTVTNILFVRFVVIFIGAFLKIYIVNLEMWLDSRAPYVKINCPVT